MKRILKTIVRDTGRYSVSNSSSLTLPNHNDLTINKLEIQGGATATTEDIIVTRSGKNLIDYKAIEYKGYAVPTLIENGFIVSGNYFALIEEVSLLPNTDYNISFISDIISLGDGATVTIFPQNSTTEKIAIFNIVRGSKGGTFNTGDYTLFKIAF